MSLVEPQTDGAIGPPQGGLPNADPAAVRDQLAADARLRREGGRLRDYQAVRWDEPLVLELGAPGRRAVLPPGTADLDDDTEQTPVSAAERYLPTSLQRPSPPALPELSQPEVVRHYLRLSQMCLGADLTPDISQGTCTMKYSPKVNEALVRSPKVAALHPAQPEESLQGILEIAHRLAGILAEISGMDEVSFQPGGGSAAAYGFAAMAHAYFTERGETGRDEIVTTIFSHPCDAACPASAGFRVVTVMPDKSGLPDLDALRAALGPRTAGLFVANPEDHGLFNPQIAEITRLVHEAGGLCYYDQANLNGIMGLARAREAGFDACHFNLHKTFSSPHGCKGPGAGALCVTAALAPYLPAPHVVALGVESDEKDGDGARLRYHLDDDRPQAIGKLRAFLGNLAVVVRAYAWVMALGADGLRAVAETSLVNNNYLERKLREIRGVSYTYAPGRRRLDQIRWSFGELKEETGFGTVDMRTRFADFGLQTWFMSHHPWVVPEPFTPEPCESYSREDLDEWAAALERCSRDAYECPEHLAEAPHNQSCHRITSWERLEDPELWAVTWRAYRRKHATT